MNELPQKTARLLIATALALVFTTSLQACGGGSSSSAVSVSPPASPPPAASEVTVSGIATYDFVPFNTTTNGLNYAATEQRPIRGAQIELLDSAGAVLGTATTSDTGAYSFEDIAANTDARVSVNARLLSTDDASYDMNVVDNTSSDALYTLQGSLASVGTANQVRDLNASSGWGGSSYTSTRASAPFAILDFIYESVSDFRAVDPNIDFPLLNIYWSTNNRPLSGNVTSGEIGTSSYTQIGSVPTLLILGAADTDTDEYDKHVIVHEFGHYFEDQISRSDSIGGSHSGGQRLDPRVAFGEGFGNALSAMILDDQFYRDSLGSQQAQGFSIDIESNSTTNEGWFNEASVQSILYDIFDSVNDGPDVVSAGLSSIYDVLTSDAYKAAVPTTTIFSFLDELETQGAVSTADITALKAAQSITGSGPLGLGETNDGGIPSSLPVYKQITAAGSPVTVCSFDDAGDYNKLNNRDFLILSVPAAGAYDVTMERVSGSASTNPDYRIFVDGLSFFTGGSDDDENIEASRLNLDVRDYFISAFDRSNAEGVSTRDACFEFKVE